MSLPPYDRYLACAKCGRAFGHAEKPLVVYCAGAVDQSGPGGSPRAPSVCELGGEEEHLHRKCSDCGFVWAEACINRGVIVEPLTAQEIALLRAAIHPKEVKP